MRRFALLAFAVPILAAGQTVDITVDNAKTIAPMSSAWAYFGYDEPNYTYAENGRKLVHELAELSREPVGIRVHHLLTTGNGVASFKWGSTNAYTEDGSGNPFYNWTILDRIVGTFEEAGAKPLIELGFMPEALSSRPNPYTPAFRTPGDFQNYYLGWAYPPKDYAKWGELVSQLVTHAVAKYGEAEVSSWDWEVWNEPNIAYWKGTPEEYDKLYDYSAAALKRALPGGHIGGPASTSPRDPKAAAFLKQFLQHCLTGKNEANGQIGAPLDFISFHAKGSPEMVDGHVRMKLGNELRDAAAGFAIVRSFERFQNLPVLLTEADPEGCAACSAKDNPANGYRNGPLYPTYEAAAISNIFHLADEDHINLKGIVTWAFEFENTPYFAGYRDLATNGVDKPVLNVFRMLGLMLGDRVEVTSSASLPASRIIEENVRGRADVDAMATKSSHGVSVLIWNYRDDDLPGAAADVHVNVAGLESTIRRVLVREYRIDESHSNSFAAWKQMGSPERPDAKQYEQLEAAGALQLLGSPRWISLHDGRGAISTTLPGDGVSLLQFGW
jgi:xylan 1,4-beta-xylosidase